jgi:hypothetical protein
MWQRDNVFLNKLIVQMHQYIFFCLTAVTIKMWQRDNIFLNKLIVQMNQYIFFLPHVLSRAGSVTIPTTE